MAQPSHSSQPPANLLVVCPHFAPVNGADAQRVRLYLPGLMAAGWTPHILACDAADLPYSSSPLLSATVPGEVAITRVRSRPTWLGRLAGASTTGRNAKRFIQAEGDRLLATRHFRAVLFSTTAFRLLPLGVRWQRRFAVPYFIDLQDPWYQDFHARHPGQKPPGGRLRYWLANRHARIWEQRVLAGASGILTVSPAYQTTLQARYPDLEAPFLSLPFGAAAADFELLATHDIGQDQFVASDGHLHLVHVGRGGTDLWPALTPLFAAIAAGLAAGADWAKRLRLQFIGTSYAPEGRQQASILPLAQQMGISSAVTEQPARIDYFQALKGLTDCHGIMLPMSSDAGYNASKIHNCVLAGRPILALAAAHSVAAQQLDGLAPQITLVDPNTDSQAALTAWLTSLAQKKAAHPPTDYPFEATRLAGQLAQFLSAHC